MTGYPLGSTVIYNYKKEKESTHKTAQMQKDLSGISYKHFGRSSLEKTMAQ